jgi:Nuclease-related domain
MQVVELSNHQLIAVELGRALDDDWTLLRGYRNRRGEIDHLLLGPRGLFAIEVKNINATVRIDGHRWRADKYDNYGNLVEQRPVTDRTGRSPSEQLNEPAGELELFLRARPEDHGSASGGAHPPPVQAGRHPGPYRPGRDINRLLAEPGLRLTR